MVDIILQTKGLNTAMTPITSDDEYHMLQSQAEALCYRLQYQLHNMNLYGLPGERKLRIQGPFAHFPTAMLFSVVKRNQYARFGSQFSAELQLELAIRRLEERRTN